MARPTLFAHRKLLRLARAIGGRALAVGHLELLWASAYESGEPVLGDVEDVEALAEWQGEPGLLAQALLDAGGPGRAGFVDRGTDGLLVIHDFWDHAPRYVRQRAEREINRQEEGKTLSDKRREAAEARWRKAAKTDATGMQMNATERRLHATGLQTDATGRAPAPAPAPAPSTRRPERSTAREARPGPPLAAADTDPGTSGKPPRKREKPPLILELPELPPPLDTPSFRTAMRKRLEERAAQPGAAARQTLPQIEAQLCQLAKVATAAGIDRAVFCVERATAGHHQGVVFKEDFEPNGNGHRSAPPVQRKTVTGAELFARGGTR